MYSVLDRDLGNPSKQTVQSREFSYFLNKDTCALIPVVEGKVLNY